MTSSGKTPLHWAAIRGFYETANFLLYRGTDMTRLDEFGMSALSYAVQGKHLEIVRVEKVDPGHTSIWRSSFPGWG